MNKPNILIITTDQQRFDSLSCYGSQFTHTPNLDRLATEGVRLDRAYCSNPVCTPSRVSLFTGQYVSRHGAWNVGVNYPESEFMASHLFTENGYRTHYIGKAHFEAYQADRVMSREGHYAWRNGYDDWHGPYHGFETVELAPGHAIYGISGHYGAWVRSQGNETQVAEWETAKSLSELEFGGQAYDWSMPLRYHNSVWTANQTIDFLKKHDTTQPFFLAVGFQDPHHPHAVPTEFQDRVDPSAVPLPDFTPGELDDKPPHFLDAHFGRLEQSAIRGDFPVAGQGSGGKYDEVSEVDARLGRTYYYTLVRLIDREVGRILDTLDTLGLSDNTLVVFTSDHGELLGDHGIWMKGPFLYEPLIRIPLLIRWPNAIRPEQSTSALFSLIDVMPTCLAAAGIVTQEPMDGVNGLPLLEGEITSIRESLLIETIDDPAKLRAKSIVTSNRKLTWYANQPYGELYDLAADPLETVNHWNDPAYVTDKIHLLSELLNHVEALERRWERHVYA